MESALPVVGEGEGLCEGLADDGAGFVGSEIAVKRWYSGSERFAGDLENRVECFKVVEDSLFGSGDLFNIKAMDGDEDVVLLIFHTKWNLLLFYRCICLIMQMDTLGRD